MPDLLTDLKKRPQWVFTDKAKIPHNPKTGAQAATDNPKTWSTYTNAQKKGLTGFVLSEEDPFIIIDFDGKNAANAKIHEKYIERFSKLTYVEKSISGKGFHVIIKGPFPGYNNALGAKASLGIEIFYAKQFVLITENTVSELPPAKLNISSFIAEIGAKTQITTGSKTAAFKELTGKSVISDKVLKTHIPEKLAKGDPSDYQDASAARMALYSHLAYNTPDNEQIRRVALPLCPKYSKYFGKSWTDKVRSRRGGEKGFIAYEIGALRLRQGVSENSPAIELKKKKAPTFSEIEFPDGLMGMLCDYAMSIAVRPIPTISLSAGLSHMAGLCGREFMLETDSPTNLYCILIARSGQGKSTVRKLTGKLLRLVDTHIDNENLSGKALMPELATSIRDIYLGGGNLASGPAVYKHLATIPGCLFTLGEVGYLLKQMTTNAHSIGVMRALLDAYQSSEGEEIAAYRYSDSEKGLGSIMRPAPSLLGDTTPSILHDSLEMEMASSGLLARFLFLFVHEPFVETHTPINKPPKDLADVFTNLAHKVVYLRSINEIDRVSFSKESWELYREQDDKWVAKSNTPIKQTDSLDDLYNRYNQHALKIAALVAIGNKAIEMPDYSKPWAIEVQLNDLEWAYQIVKRSTDYIRTCFEEGTVGGDDFSKIQAIRTVLGKYFQTDTSHFTKAERKYLSLREKNIIPRSYIQARVHRLKCFSQDPRGLDSFKRVIEAMLNTGELAPAQAKNFNGQVFRVLELKD